MEHPRGRCDRCGERLYAQLTGEYRCYNCGRERANPTNRRYRID